MNAAMNTEPSQQIHDLAAVRAQARADKDWAAADAARDAIVALGWIVTDTAQGYSLTEKPPFEQFASLGAWTSQQERIVAESAVVMVLIDGWPADALTCVSALRDHAPSGVRILVVDLGDVDGAGNAVHQFAASDPSMCVVHLGQTLAQAGWGPVVNAAIAVIDAPALVLLDMSTVLDADAITPLIRALDDHVVATGWKGAVVDTADQWRTVVDVGHGEVDVLLGYLMAVRTDAARATGPNSKAKFYRNADLEWSLALRAAGGKLVVPEAELPVHQGRHHGYHDSDPAIRDKESKRTYDRILATFRGRQDILSGRAPVLP